MFSAQFYQERYSQNVLQRNWQVIHMNAQAEFQEHEPYTVHSTLIEPEMKILSLIWIFQVYLILFKYVLFYFFINFIFYSFFRLNAVLN